MKVTFALPLALAALALGQEYAVPDDSSDLSSEVSNTDATSATSATTPTSGSASATPSLTPTSASASATPSVGAGSVTLPYFTHPLGTGRPLGTGGPLGTGSPSGGNSTTLSTGGSDESRTVSPPKSTDGANSPQTTPADGAGAIATFAPAGLGMGVAGALFAAFL